MTNSTDEISRLIARQELVFFVGAGLSMGAGLPSWTALVRPLAESVGASWPDDERYLTADHLLSAVQHFENMWGRHSLLTYMRDKLNTRDTEPSRIHKLLANQPVGTIFTTNYDDLIERAIRSIDLQPNVIVRETDLAFWSESATQVVKLCGELTQPETIVVTRSDFYTYFEDHSRLIERLRVYLESKTPLFLGYSLRDPFFNQIWDTVGVTFGKLRRKGFAVLFDPDQLEMRDLQIRNIETIGLSSQNSDHNEIFYAWLQKVMP